MQTRSSLMLCALFLAASATARADLHFTFGQTEYSQSPADIFTLQARLFSDAGSPQNYVIDHYNITVSPLPGTNDTLTTGPGANLDDFDPTGFITNFQKTFVSTGTDTGVTPLDFVSFQLGANAPFGQYDIAIELQDANSVTLTTQNFQLNVAPSAVPAPNSALVFAGGLLALGGMAARKRARRG